MASSMTRRRNATTRSRPSRHGRAPNTFPDPRGTGIYVIDGKSHAWQGRGREIGVTVMKPGDQIKVYYNPQNPQEISTLVLLGASTGSIIMAVAFAFLAFYFWF